MLTILGADGNPLPPFVPTPEYMIEFFAYETIGVGTDIANCQPTSHYHIGKGVAWVKRSGNSDVTCAATLPSEVFDQLEGGEERSGFRDIAAMRIYASTDEAQQALREARIRLPKKT